MLGILEITAGIREKAQLIKKGNYSESHMKQVKDQIRFAIPSAIKNMCEVITASDSLRRPHPLFGWAYSEGFCASSGLTSSIISLSMLMFSE